MARLNFQQPLYRLFDGKAFFQTDFLKDMDKGAVLTHESQRAEDFSPSIAFRAVSQTTH